MRIATLQFAPELGQVTSNIARADALLEAAAPQDLDLLVLPELAFSGYNHPSFSAILPYLEPTAAGPSTTWAQKTASRFNCIVTVGYPELSSTTPITAPDNPPEAPPPPPAVAYNSTVTVAPNGSILAHYRKTHLYYTDETWAQESPTGWLTTSLPLPPPSFSKPTPPPQITNTTDDQTPPPPTLLTTFGICMDLNPHRFTAPWTAYELSTHTLRTHATLLLLSMAWLTSLPTQSLHAHPTVPDLDTFSYWLSRLQPLIDSEEGDSEKGDGEVLIVCANRCGEEPGGNPCGQVEGGARYAGTSWVGRVGGGRLSIWGVLGRGVEGVLVADTGVVPLEVGGEGKGEGGRGGRMNGERVSEGRREEGDISNIN